MENNFPILKGRITVIVMAVFSVLAVVYAYIQHLEAKNIMNSLVESKEEQVRLKETLKSCEDKNAMLEYRSQHLKQSLENEKEMTQELLKRSR
jgi:Tfp pilus assembly protein PilO